MEERALVKNSASSKQVRKAKKVEAFRRRQREDDLKFVLSDARGRRLLWRILDMTGLSGEAAVPGNAEQTYFNCGMQRIGRVLRSDIITVSEESYFTMMKEALAESKAQFQEAEEVQEKESEITEDEGETQDE